MEKPLEKPKDLKFKKEIKEVKKKKQASLTFRENRKYDLHIARQVITFRGRETKTVPQSWLNDKDFNQVRKNFVIKEA